MIFKKKTLITFIVGNTPATFRVFTDSCGKPYIKCLCNGAKVIFPYYPEKKIVVYFGLEFPCEGFLV